MNRGYLQEFVDYIANTGGGPTLEQFDEDWQPIGPKVRADLKAARMTVELDGRIYDAAKDAVSLIQTKKNNRRGSKVQPRVRKRRHRARLPGLRSGRGTERVTRA